MVEGAFPRALVAPQSSGWRGASSFHLSNRLGAEELLRRGRRRVTTLKSRVGPGLGSCLRTFVVAKPERLSLRLRIFAFLMLMSQFANFQKNFFAPLLVAKLEGPLIGTGLHAGQWLASDLLELTDGGGGGPAIDGIFTRLLSGIHSI